MVAACRLVVGDRIVVDDLDFEVDAVEMVESGKAVEVRGRFIPGKRTNILYFEPYEYFERA